MGLNASTGKNISGRIWPYVQSGVMVRNAETGEWTSGRLFLCVKRGEAENLVKINVKKFYVKNSLLGLLLVTFPFTALADQTLTLEYVAAYSEGLGLEEADLQKLHKVLDDIKDSQKKVTIHMRITRAEGIDYDGELMGSSRGKQVALLRGLRLRDYIHASSQIRPKLELIDDTEAKSNQVRLDILEK